MHGWCPVRAPSSVPCHLPSPFPVGVSWSVATVVGFLCWGVGLGGGVQQYSGYWRPWRPSIGCGKLNSVRGR